MYPSWLHFALVKLVLSVALFVVSVIILKYWGSRRRLRQLASEISGPTSLTILGDLLDFCGNAKNTFKVVNDKWRQYGNTFRIWLGPLLYVILSDPKDVEVIIGSPNIITRDSHMMKVVEAFLGDGLVTSSGERWRKHRKIITPTFHFKILEQFIDVFNKNSEILVTKLESFADGSTFDVFALAGLCTLDMICETAMGTGVNAQYNSENAFVWAMERGIQLIHDRVVRPWLRIDWLYNMTERGKDQRAARKVLHGFTEGVIAKKLQAFRDKRSTGEDTAQESFAGEKRRLAFLDLLIEASETQGALLSEDEIRNEVYTLTMAGQETTATTSCFTLMMLGMYPEYQNEVFCELKAIFGDSVHRPVTSADLHRMKYLERVIKETLRLFPAAPFMPREIHEELKLSTCTLPAGCTAVANNYAIHRNPEYFPEPEKFDPERFLPENVLRRHPYCYLPFGGGSRNCVGNKYAMMQMKTVLATVLKSYEVLSACTRQDLDNLEVGLVIKPARGFLVKLLPRRWDW